MEKRAIPKILKELFILAMSNSDRTIPVTFLNEKKGKETIRNKKIEQFVVCPICGSHKKANKANPEGTGSKVRKRKREFSEELELDIKYDRQRHIEKYHDVKDFGKELAEKTKKAFTQLFKEDPPVEEIYNYFITYDQENPILRQPFFDTTTTPEKKKFLSIRINFGNPYLSKIRKYIRERCKEIVSKQHTEEEEINIPLNIETEIEFPEEDLTLGEFEELPENPEEAVFKLFPSMETIENPRGVVEVHTLSLGELLQIIKFLKGKSVKDIAKLLKAIDKSFKIAPPISKEMYEQKIQQEALFLCISISFFYAQLKELASFLKEMAGMIEKNL